VSTLWDALVGGATVVFVVVATVRLAHRLAERSHPAEPTPSGSPEPTPRH
jgi:hypothetical protein